MRVLLTTGLLLAIASMTFTYAGDGDQKPMPPDAQAALDQYDKAVETAKAKAIKALEAAQTRCHQKGDADGERAIAEHIAKLKGEEVAAPAAPRPGTPDALIAAIKDGTIDEATWKALNAPEVPCKAADLTDLRVTLTANQRAVVVPCPTDRWQSDPGSAKANYQGESFHQGSWPRESMTVRVGEAADTTRRVADDPVCLGPGKLYVAAYDTGSASRVGSIRVKVLVLPR